MGEDAEQEGEKSTQPEPSKPRACEECRRAHKLCSRTTPCTRCSAQGIECLPPQARKPKEENTRKTLRLLLPNTPAETPPQWPVPHPYDAHPAQLGMWEHLVACRPVLLEPRTVHPPQQLHPIHHPATALKRSLRFVDACIPRSSKQPRSRPPEAGRTQPAAPPGYLSDLPYNARLRRLVEAASGAPTPLTWSPSSIHVKPSTVVRHGTTSDTSPSPRLQDEHSLQRDT
jgi:hypothetical protein